jgi:uncharacterized membrane protein
MENQPKNWHRELHDKRTFGQKASDFVSKTYGSWAFIIIWLLIVTVYIGYNAIVPRSMRWDSYPFLFLNLALGIPVFFAGMIIMNAQNRQEQRDRAKADRDFDNDQRTLEIVEKLDMLIARIETDKLDRIIADVEKKPAAEKNDETMS